MDMMLGRPRLCGLPSAPVACSPLPHQNLALQCNLDDLLRFVEGIRNSAKNESATDWVYWIESDSNGGTLSLNAPPAIIGEALLPKDADKVVVKEDGLTVGMTNMSLVIKRR